MAVTLATHQANRATAGTNYVTALNTLVLAYIELHAYDITTRNSSYSTQSGYQAGVPSFGPMPEVTCYAHGEFLRDVRTVANDIPGRAQARAA